MPYFILCIYFFLFFLFFCSNGALVVSREAFSQSHCVYQPLKY